MDRKIPPPNLFRLRESGNRGSRVDLSRYFNYRDAVIKKELPHSQPL